MTAEHSRGEPGHAPSGIRAATPSDATAVIAFISGAGLPTADLATALARFWVAAPGATIHGVIGLEAHGAVGLLRSLAVAVDHRRNGLGTQLVDYVEIEAARLGIADLVLLTESAEEFFADLGYDVVSRESIVGSIRESPEFRGLCPASARCMRKRLA